jgi:hypothetical protein
VARPLTYLVTIAAAALAVLGLASPARAADAPTALTIEGPGLSAPISVHGTEQSDLFDRLEHQVSWMATRAGDQMNPDPAGLGARYQLTVLAGSHPLQRYDMYPQASGGPKAHRPADQPSGHTSEAWFYVSLSVPELMHAAGVPLSDPSATDGADGLVYRDPAGYVPANSSTADHSTLSLTDLLHAQRRTLLLWAGTAVAVLLLVLGAARINRRYSQRRLAP